MQKRTRTIVQQVEESANKVSDTGTALELLSTGSTLLDLACSDSSKGGFALGRMVNLIGDSSSGKTLLCLSLLAEACSNPRFDDYRIVFDDVEAAMSFDIKRLFGASLDSRIEAPETDDNDEPVCSDTIQQFQYHALKALDGDRPVIYVLDSFDALSSDEEVKRVGEAMKAYDDGKESKGTYAMEKAKIGGRALAMIVRKLKKTKSIVIIISQTRDNIDPMSFQKKTRSGGKALKFYASHEIWMACGKKIKSKERTIGVDAVVKVTKNKITGKVRDVQFPVFYDYGIDDIGSCIDFMVKEKFWDKTGLTITAAGLDIVGTRAKLIEQIEAQHLERKMKRALSKAWLQIEDSLKLNRRSRYV